MLMPDTRPMLEVAWAPFLGAISIAFEESDDESITSLCMDAFYYVIKVAAPQEMETVRDAFLTSLAKATHLHMPIGKMHQKRGEAFKTLLNVALQCGNHLHFMRMKFIFLFIFLLLLRNAYGASSTILAQQHQQQENVKLGFSPGNHFSQFPVGK